MNTAELTFTLPHAVAGVMVLSLNAYVLLGGADFGGGVWDLFARGPHREAQRALIADAIGPIWEANHVWLILVVVLLFTCFPVAYAHLATELHVPITLMLVGVVLRGSAFTFRTYDSTRDAVQHRWGRIFSVASVATPVLLGLCFGTVASGRVPLVGGGSGVRGVDALQSAPVRSFVERFINPWATSPFAWTVGVLTLALFAFLAATYLTVEARDREMQNEFRTRALQSQGAMVIASVVAVLLAKRDAPLMYEGLTTGSMALVMHVITALSVVASVVLLKRGAYKAARLAAAAQATFILWAWAWSQFPLLIPPSQPIASLAAPRITLVIVLGVLLAGTLILLPSFLYLFRIFKSGDSVFAREGKSSK